MYRVCVYAQHTPEEHITRVTSIHGKGGLHHSVREDGGVNVGTSQVGSINVVVYYNGTTED